MKAVVSWVALAVVLSPGLVSAADRPSSSVASRGHDVDDVPVVAKVSGSAVVGRTTKGESKPRGTHERGPGGRAARETRDDEHKKTAHLEASESEPHAPRLARVSAHAPRERIELASTGAASRARPLHAAAVAHARTSRAPAKRGAEVAHHEPTVLVPASLLAQPVRIEKASAGHAPRAVARVEPRRIEVRDVVVGAESRTTVAIIKEPVETRAKASVERPADGKADPKRAALLRRASTHDEPSHTPEVTPKKVAKDKPVCLRDAVEIVRGAEVDRFALATCEGQTAPLAVEKLSVMLRAGSGPRAKIDRADADLGAGARRIDPRLVDRLQSIVGHFVKPGTPARVSVVSGYRPGSAGSQHAHARAMDIRLDGVANEEVVQFCKTLVDTGCGYYPNSSFVHVDVRPQGTGHVQWIDASGPGEMPRYVSAWPAPKDEAVVAPPGAENLEGETHTPFGKEADGEGAGD